MNNQHYERENPEFWNKKEKDITKDQLKDARKQIERLENDLTLAYLEYGIAIKTLKKIGIEQYYLTQTVAKEALKQLGEY